MLPCVSVHVLVMYWCLENVWCDGIPINVNMYALMQFKVANDELLIFKIIGVAFVLRNSIRVCSSHS